MDSYTTAQMLTSQEHTLPLQIFWIRSDSMDRVDLNFKHLQIIIFKAVIKDDASASRSFQKCAIRNMDTKQNTGIDCLKSDA